MNPLKKSQPVFFILSTCFFLDAMMIRTHHIGHKTWTLAMLTSCASGLHHDHDFNDEGTEEVGWQRPVWLDVSWVDLHEPGPHVGMQLFIQGEDLNKNNTILVQSLTHDVVLISAP